MQGGDLQNALKGLSTAPALSWYNRGAQIALDIIQGLHFLHSNNVSLRSTCAIAAWASQCSQGRLPTDNHNHLVLHTWLLCLLWLSELVLLSRPAWQHVSICLYFDLQHHLACTRCACICICHPCSNPGTHLCSLPTRQHAMQQDSCCKSSTYKTVAALNTLLMAQLTRNCDWCRSSVCELDLCTQHHQQSCHCLFSASHSLYALSKCYSCHCFWSASMCLALPVNYH